MHDLLLAWLIWRSFAGGSRSEWLNCWLYHKVARIGFLLRSGRVGETIIKTPSKSRQSSLRTSSYVISTVRLHIPALKGICGILVDKSGNVFWCWFQLSAHCINLQTDMLKSWTSAMRECRSWARHEFMPRIWTCFHHLAPKQQSVLLEMYCNISANGGAKFVGDS